MSTAEARIPAPLMGMTLFIASEVVLFGGLFGAYYALRAQAQEWPPSGTPELGLLRPAILTIVLLASSVTQHRAHSAHREGRAASTVRWMWITALLGAAFLAGEASEWATLFDEGFNASSNIYGALFFTITGAHGLHLFVGLGILALTAGTVARRGAGEASRGPVEAATYYWHFVDVVWLGVATTVYLLGAA